MNPLHSKPFNIDHAQAGAPFSFDDGESAEIIKWDRHGSYPIIVLRGKSQYVFSMSSIGYGSSKKLVMLPLGMIDGKPVFVNDEVMQDGVKYPVHPMNFNFTGCYWPAPANVYPVSLMTFSELSDEYDRYHIHATSIRSMANAVLRHAIDAGQVIIAEVKS